MRTWQTALGAYRRICGLVARRLNARRVAFGVISTYGACGSSMVTLGGDGASASAYQARQKAANLRRHHRLAASSWLSCWRTFGSRAAVAHRGESASRDGGAASRASRRRIDAARRGGICVERITWRRRRIRKVDDVARARRRDGAARAAHQASGLYAEQRARHRARRAASASARLRCIWISMRDLHCRVSMLHRGCWRWLRGDISDVATLLADRALRLRYAHQTASAQSRRRQKSAGAVSTRGSMFISTRASKRSSRFARNARHRDDTAHLAISARTAHRLR